MKSIKEALDAIASTPKRTEKEFILESIKSSDLNDEFKRVAFLALDPRHVFNIVEYDQKEFLTEHSSVTHTLSEALDIIEAKILNEGVRGNAAKELLFELSGQLTADDQYVLKCIIDRTLRCGVSDKTINKVWKDLIYIHPYRRCSSFSEKNIKKITLPAISQLKEDGMYVDIVVGDKVEYRSRQGGYFDWNVEDNDRLLRTHAKQHVLMGEALVKDEHGDIMDRQTGNGYLNGDDVDPSRIIFSLWDIIPLSDWRAGKSSQPYSDTYNKLLDVIPKLNYSFRIVDTKIVDTVDDIVAHFKENVNKGLEGSVAKNLNSTWKDGTSADWVKVKLIFDVELEVVSVYEGEKGRKYEGKMGGVTAKTSDGLLISDVGGGWKDSEREKYFDNPALIVGKIITVKACDISKSEDNEFFALSNPRFIEVRNDKSVADSFERVKEQKQASVESLKIIT